MRVIIHTKAGSEAETDIQSGYDVGGHVWTLPTDPRDKNVYIKLFCSSTEIAEKISAHVPGLVTEPDEEFVVLSKVSAPEGGWFGRFTDDPHQRCYREAAELEALIKKL